MFATLSNRPLANVLVAFPLVSCQCAGPAIQDDVRDSMGARDEPTGSGSGSGSGSEGTTEAAGPPIDVSRFLGVFHLEPTFIPFGRETENLGGAMVANLEIRPDGTASMSLETCNTSYGPLLIDWYWDARPGPVLEFTPGPGEESLRFLALTDLDSVVVMPGEGCDLVVDAKGEHWVVEGFGPGRACWVNRCETWNTVHIDYCDGEPPPPCE